MRASPALAQSSPVAFSAARLEQLFAACFARNTGTQLVGGAAEPLYQPAQAAGEHPVLYYREDFFASALHEVAHWCIAGEARRKLVDFGYWYAPEGRTPAQQQAFEAAECKPQALEWLFSRACGYRFVLSLDNLNPVDGSVPDSDGFRQRVHRQALRWQAAGLPARAHVFFQALSIGFGTQVTCDTLQLCMAELG